MATIRLKMSQLTKESQVSQESHANFYTTGMACRAMDERRKGGIQSRGTTKKEEPEKEEPEKNLRKKNLRKKNLRKKKLRKKKLPARIVEQAGVPIDRVIGLSRKRILIAHIWSMLS